MAGKAQPHRPGKAIEEARNAAGITQAELWFRLKTDPQMPQEFVVGQTTLGRITADEAGASTMLLAGIARACGVPLASISTDAAAEVEAFRSFFDGALTPTEQVERRTACYVDSAGLELTLVG